MTKRPETYSIEFTPAGLDYVRGVLGARPHDEVRPLIDELTMQRYRQDEAPAVTGEAEGVAPVRPAPRTPRPRKGLNGAGPAAPSGPVLNA